MSHQQFFRNISEKEPDFFDEGPVIFKKIATVTNSGSIETIRIDGYRQGVELTQQKHFDAGIGKIHAGEPGHFLRQNRFGMDNRLLPEPEYKDLDYFSSLNYIKAQAQGSALDGDIVTFPIIIGDTSEVDNFIFNGAIEPLTIRSIASFYSIDVPFEAHSIKAGLMNSTEDTTRASSLIVTVNDYDTSPNYVPYLDMVDMSPAQQPTNGYFVTIKAALKPFADVRYLRNIISSSSDSETSTMNAALSLMTGSTDNYISLKQRSATSGWDYDYNVSGTDSLAFGGMTF